MYFTLLFFLFLSLTGCEKIALLTTPKKNPTPSHTIIAKTAEQHFWKILHEGNYAEIPAVNRELTAAYLDNPSDPTIASHLGFIHIWKIAERARQKEQDPLIVNDIILAKKYFSDAHELNPHDARIKGFLGDSMLIEGKIFKDEREEVQAYFKLKKAINDWPEFNYFAAGYPMSMLPYHSKGFREALNWQWETLKLCANDNIKRTHPDFRPYLHLETQTGSKRACWNSWIAPHNFEGFFLNMGDMLIKNGELETGIAIYNNAKLSSSYHAWPYRQLLEKRIAQAKKNRDLFRKNQISTPETTMIFNSGYACAICHQKKE